MQFETYYLFFFLDLKLVFLKNKEKNEFKNLKIVTNLYTLKIYKKKNASLFLL